MLRQRVVAVLVGLFVAPLGLADVWNEVGDADELPGTAQVVTVPGVLDRIEGFLQNHCDGQGCDDVDMYCIQILDPDNFAVNMEGTNLTVDNDTMLWLFDAAGNLVLSDDDDGDGLLSEFFAGELAGNPPGTYYIAVSLFATVPGDDPITHWDRDPSPFQTGPYVLNIAGTDEPPPQPVLSRLDTAQKGSLLIFPKVEMRFDAAGNLLQDTFIEISNDFTQDVHVLTYFIAEDCTNVYADIDLTKNQPVFWSMATGLPYGLAPLPGLKPPVLDPETGDFVLRGAYIAFAANANNQQIRWNHLTGLATIVNYAQGWATEYYPYASQVVATNVPNGAVAGVPGTLLLDGLLYQAPYNRLLLDFQAAGSTGFSGGGRIVTHDTAVGLLIANMDLRQDNLNPIRTKAKYNIWNAEELSYETEYCFNCWDCRRFSSIGGILLVENLQTANGRAVIDGQESPVCGPDTSPNPLLGVALKFMTFDNGQVTAAGETLPGMGVEPALIRYDIPEPPEEQAPQPKVKASLPSTRR
ncbi:MAG: hypothetical protein LC135_04755 [Phycisphaerae bacterium]|nr:hypothetical protein [Phycisphaerae bacterium]MCZ2399165.1 hypothetical protein [Phycisphaerae bacterium]NUQ49470.1 hypothetical protein [Phycisphaerae bacterium]